MCSTPSDPGGPRRLPRVRRGARVHLRAAAPARAAGRAPDGSGAVAARIADGARRRRAVMSRAYFRVRALTHPVHFLELARRRSRVSTRARPELVAVRPARWHSVTAPSSGSRTATRSSTSTTPRRGCDSTIRNGQSASSCADGRGHSMPLRTAWASSSHRGDTARRRWPTRTRDSPSRSPCARRSCSRRLTSSAHERQHAVRERAARSVPESGSSRSPLPSRMFLGASVAHESRKGDSSHTRAPTAAPLCQARRCMDVHLVDGTYELFRQFLAPRPGHLDPDGIEVGATRGGRARRCSRMLEDGATHLGVATDHVIESFRNDLWDDVQDGRGHRPAAVQRSSRCSKTRSRRWASRCGRWSSSKPTTRSRGGARSPRPTTRVEQVIICTPDKDLGQCVGGKVVQLDRRKDMLLDADGRARQVRCAARVDSRLARARRRQRRRLPRACPASAPRPRRHCSRATATSRRSPTIAQAWDVPGVRGADRLPATLAAGREVADRFKDPRHAAHRRRRSARSTTGNGAARRRPRGLVRAVRIAETRRPAPRSWRSVERSSVSDERRGAGRARRRRASRRSR